MPNGSVLVFVVSLIVMGSLAATGQPWWLVAVWVVPTLGEFLLIIRTWSKKGYYSDS